MGKNRRKQLVLEQINQLEAMLDGIKNIPYDPYLLPEPERKLIQALRKLEGNGYDVRKYFEKYFVINQEREDTYMQTQETL